MTVTRHIEALNIHPFADHDTPSADVMEISQTEGRPASRPSEVPSGEVKLPMGLGRLKYFRGYPVIYYFFTFFGGNIEEAK